jgi:glycogen debranching enzyme
VERALEWIDRWGDTDGDGFVDYRSRSERGLVNQGWKDSGNAIVDADGRPAEPPIAMVEVQGYVYRARLEIADLFERTGDAARAAALRRQAAELRDKFNRDFWLDDKGVYALALQSGGRPAAVVSSNPGHALWAGIAEPQKARHTRERLTADDMFSGWGIRTLADSERADSPISHHRGTVWPHDNSIIAAGFKAYGFDTAVAQVADGILDAAAAFDDFVLPEAFAGFSRRDYAVPIRYPVACHPQAWAAGSVPHLLETVLGLEPDGFAGRLRIVRPMLPHMTDRIEVARMKVGRGRADLAFERTAEGVGGARPPHRGGSAGRGGRGADAVSRGAPTAATMRDADILPGWDDNPAAWGRSAAEAAAGRSVGRSFWGSAPSAKPEDRLPIAPPVGGG